MRAIALALLGSITISPQAPDLAAKVNGLDASVSAIVASPPRVRSRTFATGTTVWVSPADARGLALVGWGAGGGGGFGGAGFLASSGSAGGGGGGAAGGGPGIGGYVRVTILPSTSYTITVGAGGAGGIAATLTDALPGGDTQIVPTGGGTPIWIFEGGAFGVRGDPSAGLTNAAGTSKNGHMVSRYGNQGHAPENLWGSTSGGNSGSTGAAAPTLAATKNALSPWAGTGIPTLAGIPVSGVSGGAKGGGGGPGGYGGFNIFNCTARTQAIGGAGGDGQNASPAAGTGAVGTGYSDTGTGDGGAGGGGGGGAGVGGTRGIGANGGQGDSGKLTIYGVSTVAF